MPMGADLNMRGTECREAGFVEKEDRHWRNRWNACARRMMTEEQVVGAGAGGKVC